MAQLVSLFPRGSTRTETGAPATLTGQLTEMAATHPRHAAETLAQCIADIRRQRHNLRGQIRSLEQVYFHANLVLNQLEKMLEEARLPLNSTSRIAASTADRLIKQMAEAYSELAFELNSKWLRMMYRSALELATFRAVQLIHRRSQLALRAFATGSSRRWGQFTRLYALARANGFHRKNEAGSEDSIEHIIARNCLLALADPGSLGNNEVGWLRFFIERHGDRAQLRSRIPDERGAGLFVIGDKHGPRRLSSSHQLGADELLLDCRPVLKKLKRQIVGLRKGIAPQRLGLPMAAKDPGYIFLLQRCTEQWTEPRTRRQSRNKFKPRADLVAGFDSTRHFLTSAAFRRRSTDQIPGGVGNALSQTSEWAILDQSPSGFGLRFVNGHAAAIAVGEVVALRPRESATVHLCVTRRARSIGNADFELGLELLGDNGIPTTINKPVGGGRNVGVPTVLIPKVPCLNNSPGLLVPIGDAMPGMSITMPYKGRTIRLEVVETAETLASCDLVRLRPRRVDTGVESGSPPQRDDPDYVAASEH